MPRQASGTCALSVSLSGDAPLNGTRVRGAPIRGLSVTHLLESLLGGVPPGAAGGGALLGSSIVPHAPFFVFPLTGAEAHVVPTTAPAFLHRF